MKGELPQWYPLANATDDEIGTWLAAAVPPYEEMREALPWYNHKYQFDAWIEGVREGRTADMGENRLHELLPGIGTLPLPPRRIEGRQS